MRLAILSGSDDRCRECGLPEPVVIGGTGERIETTILDLVEMHARRRELEVALAAKEEIAMLDELLRQEAGELKEKLAASHREYEDAVEAIVGSRARRWRVLKRRWQRQLEADVHDAVERLREETRRA